ncbi:MAG: YfhO family protein [Gemmatimonadota bacterium]|nr:YfhO family protein [Gemmatimonadota bacterium]
MARKSRADRGARHGSAAPTPSTGKSTSHEPGLAWWVPGAVFVVLAGYLFREFVFSDRMLVGSDTLGLGYMARAFYAHAVGDLGDFPLWAPNLLGGTPFLEALSGGDSLYPTALLLFVMEPYRALGWKLVIHVLAAGFLMFGWVRTLGASRSAALLAGVAYMLAPFFVSLVHPGHDGKIFVTALAPLLFWMVERHFVRARLATFAGVGLTVALVLFTTHFQMAYFLFAAVGCYALFRAVQSGRERGSRAFGTFLLASLLGAGGAGVQLLPAADYVTEYSRRTQTTDAGAGETGVAWSSSWSLHPEEVASLVIPEFPGNNANGSAWTSGTYWGRNAFKDNHEYAGLLVLLLAAVSFAGGRRRGLRLFLTGMGAVALAFALGTHTPVWRVFYELVPGISLFRAPSQAIFLFGFAAVTLAALGLDRVLEAIRDGSDAGWRPVGRTLLGGAAVMSVLALLAGSGALTSLWGGLVYPGADPGRLSAVLPHLARGAGVGALLAWALWGVVWALRGGYVGPSLAVAAVVGLAAVDALRVDAPFVQVMNFHEWSRPDPNIRALLDREADNPEPYRLVSLAGRAQDVTPAMHGIELATGHHPNDLGRYRELIGMKGSEMPANIFNPNVRALLNVRYILWPDWELGPAPEGPVVSQAGMGGGRIYATLLADGAGLPRARLVSSAVVKSDQEAVPYILSPAHDPAREAVLAEAPPIALDGEPVTGTVTWEERGLDRMRWSVTTDRPALLVVGDNWFPAWKATVDGVDAPVLRAYHTLRAVPVQAGEHTVEMYYRSEALTRGLWLTLVILVSLVGMGAWGWWAGRKDVGATGAEPA